MKQLKPVKDLYLIWLINLIKDKKSKSSFSMLIGELHKKHFIWFVQNDDNRYEDGINLRYLFIKEHGFDEDHIEVSYFLKSKCTILEMLIALSIRMNDIMYDIANQKDNTAKWFFELLNNLKLTKYTDLYFKSGKIDPVSEAEIDEILEILINRQYNKFGDGSLFPASKITKKDLSKVEIWYQMMGYLSEKYDY